MGKEDFVKNMQLLFTVVAEIVELDENNFGLCPFHEEKTPSFNIFLAESGRARFHCFGCGADGDVFNFARRIYNLGWNAAYFRVLQIAQELNLNTTSGEVAPQASSFRASEYQIAARNTDSSSADWGRNCYTLCRNYANLREDYYSLLKENQRLREMLGLPEPPVP